MRRRNREDAFIKKPQAGRRRLVVLRDGQLSQMVLHVGFSVARLVLEKLEPTFRPPPAFSSESGSASSHQPLIDPVMFLDIGDQFFHRLAGPAAYGRSQLANDRVVNGCLFPNLGEELEVVLDQLGRFASGRLQVFDGVIQRQPNSFLPSYALFENCSLSRLKCLGRYQREQTGESSKLLAGWSRRKREKAA